MDLPTALTDPIVIASILAIIAAVLTFYLSEKSKRKWALSDEYWHLKYDLFNESLTLLEDLNMVYSSIGGLDNYGNKQKSDEENLGIDIAIWKWTKAHFFNGNYVLSTWDEISRLNDQRITRFVHEVRDVLLSKNNELIVQTEFVETKLSIIIDDISIVDDIIALSHSISGLEGPFDDYKKKSLDTGLKELQRKMKVELEATRSRETPHD
jgi:hypothetical protein